MVDSRSPTRADPHVLYCININMRYALRHDHDHIVRGLYTRMQVQAVLQQLWQHVAHWQVSRVSPLGLAFSVFVPLQRCVTFDGQFFVPNDVAIETTMLPHARPLW